MSVRACSTCSRWDASREPLYAKGAFGVCRLPCDEHGVDEKTLLFVDDGPYGEGGGNVWTRCDFGCQEWEERA